MRRLDYNYWKGRRVFLTGHTGFKGSWLTYWLTSMGAEVRGYSLAPISTPSMFDLLQLNKLIDHQIGDIRNSFQLSKTLEEFDPEVVLHLAAQPIVSEGYTNPVETFEINVMGVVYLLEACRLLNKPLPVVIVSSDKCYLNDGNGRAFEIEDPLGGFDPYSASKAGTEIVTNSYRASFFDKPNAPRIASARAGNVVGGGDWSLDRLLPDCARAFHEKTPVILRNPMATRPWQHVLEPLYGYLMLAQALEEDTNFARPWNFGPIDRNHQDVGTVATVFCDAWGEGAKIELSKVKQDWKEAATLDLDCAETTRLLQFKPVLDLDSTVGLTADWYRRAYSASSVEAIRQLTLDQIHYYENLQAGD